MKREKNKENEQNHKGEKNPLFVNGRVRLSYSTLDDPFLKRMIISGIEYATGRKRIEKAYTDIRNEIQNPIDVWPAIIDRLGFSMNFDKEKWLSLPKE